MRSRRYENRRSRRGQAGVRTPVMWGLVFGAIQAASPLAFWWLDAATVYALGLALIASIYIGFAVADGRPTVIAVESSVAAIFVIVAAAARDRIAMAARPRPRGPRAQGSLAAPPQVRREHPVVAAFLPRRRLARGRDHRNRDPRRRPLPLTVNTGVHTAGRVGECAVIAEHVDEAGDVALVNRRRCLSRPGPFGRLDLEAHLSLQIGEQRAREAAIYAKRLAADVPSIV